MMFEIDGVAIPATECDWQLLAPCGCVVGLCMVQLGSMVLADEASAWREWYPTARTRRRKREQGYTTRIASRRDGVRLLREECPHVEAVER